MAQSPLIQPDIRSQMIARMLMEGADTSPVQHWTQGMARALKGAVGGFERGREEYEARQAPGEILKMWQASQQQPMPQAQPQHPLGPVTPGPRPPSAPPAVAQPSMMATQLLGNTGAGAGAPQMAPDPSAGVTASAAAAPPASMGRSASRLGDALLSRLGIGTTPGGGGGGWGGGGGANPMDPISGNLAAGAAVANTDPQVASAGAAMQPPPQQALAMAEPSSRDPRGIRNNNPLNIEAGQFTQRQPGFAGSDGRFARFEQPQQGIEAASNLLASYGQRGINTIAGVINRWAPASDGNPVNAYAQHVARKLGIGPNDQIDLSNPNTRQQLVMAMGEFENGRPIQVAQAGGAPVAMPQGGQPTAPQGPQQAPSGQPNIAMIQQMINHPNPRVRAFGTQLMQQQMTQEPKYMVVGDKLVEISNRQVRTVADADKPPAGYERVDPSDPKKGLRAIAGGPATHVPAEAAGRIAMMDTAARDMPAARNILLKNRGEYGYGTTDVANRGASLLGIGEVGQAQRTVRLGIEAALRVMTGAAAPEQEVRRYMDLFMPSQNDTEATAKQKLDNLDRFMADARRNVMQGRTSEAPPTGGGAVRRFNPATGAIE